MSTTLHVRTLSPLLIGTNQEMQPFEYIVADGVLYRLDADALFGRILDERPDAADVFSDWLDANVEQIGRAERQREYGRLTELRRSFTLVEFVRRRLGDNRLAQEIDRDIRTGKLAMYAMRCESLEGLSVERRNGSLHSTRRSKGTIAVAIKTGSQQLYIPGSSLKGVLRTAMLYAVLSEADGALVATLAEELHRKLNKLRSQDRIRDADRKFFDETLESLVFYCGTNHRDGTKWDDPKFDLFKLVSVGDSTVLVPEHAGWVVPVDVYCAGGTVQSITPAAETIAPGNVVQMELRIGTAFIEQARQWLRSGNAVFGRTQWIGIEERFARLYGCSIEEATADRIVGRLLDAARRFGAAIADRDRQWATQHFPDLAAFYDKLPPTAAMMGYASGFHATTVMLAMIANPKLRAIEQEVVRLFGIRSRSSQRSISLDSFPTSRRMATPDAIGKPALPLGWVELSLEPLQRLDSTTGAAATTTSVRTEPIEPPIAETLRPGATVCARIVEVAASGVSVELLARGQEGKAYRCSGVGNTSGLSVGTIVRVRVNMHPKTKQVQSLTYAGLWKP